MAEAPPLPDTSSPPWLRESLGDATGRGVRVAVIDSGRDADWQDPRFLSGLGLVAEKGFQLQESNDDDDRLGHGTACSDLLLGMAPGIEILPIRVFGERLETSPQILVHAIDRAVDEGCGLINLSLGTLLEDAATDLYRACERARQAGVLVVAAVHRHAGWSYPAAFDHVLGVQAGRFDNIWTFEYLPEEAGECKAQGDREVRWLAGERRRALAPSFAAPHLTALVARLREQRPDLDADGVRTFLQSISTTT